MHQLGKDSARAVPRHMQALAAAQQAEKELANGLEWEYDDSLPGAARTSATAAALAERLTWKRYDPDTERAVEAAFQAQTTHLTLASATWRLGEEFIRREGDGVCSISLVRSCRFCLVLPIKQPENTSILGILNFICEFASFVCIRYQLTKNLTESVGMASYKRTNEQVGCVA